MTPDDTSTIHIRCGSDILPKLRAAGFVGAFLEVSDPLPQGPVPDGDGLVAIRAGFAARAYEQDEATVRAGLNAEQAGLAAAAASDVPVVLWFEHDSYDQLILARVLAGVAGRPGVALICIDAHPGVQGRFIGLGQLTAADLLGLWPTRTAVGPAQFVLGRAVWDALRHPSPEPLFAIASGGTPAIPPMAAALLRHLQELPWAGDGLSLTERLLLRAIADGAQTAGQVFGPAQRAEPLPFLGDLMILPVLRDLAAAATPAISLDQTGPWAQRSVALTAAGSALLTGAADWQTMGPPERWVGGVCIGPGMPAWQWDGRPVHDDRSP